MIRCIAYGEDSEGNHYVQSCCNEEHLGQECDCKSFGEKFTFEEARALAIRKAKELKVPLEPWVEPEKHNVSKIKTLIRYIKQKRFTA